MIILGLFVGAYPNMKTLTNLQRGLVEDHMDFAKRVAKRYARSWNIDNEDLISVAYLALVSCVSNYDSTKGRFITHCYLRVHGACRDWIESQTIQEGYNRTAKKYIVIRLPMTFDDFGEFAGEERNLISNDNFSSDLEKQDLIDKMLNIVTPRCKQLIIGIFKGHNAFEIAKIFGLTQASVSNQRHKFIIKAKNYLKDLENVN